MVVAPSMADLVRHAGGWLFDQAAAGWDVTVLTTPHTDPRPLRILGARTADLESMLSAPIRGPRPQALAVDTELCVYDLRARRMVLEALEHGPADVRLWGDGCPLGCGCAEGSMSHRLSAAARAFKAQALAAAAVPADSCQATELFQKGELLRPSNSV